LRLKQLATVNLSDVRDTINISEKDIPDGKLQKMIKRAETTLSLELGREVDSANCTEPEKEFITLLSAVYAICFLTGGSAVGLSFTVGDQTVSASGNTPPLNVLQQELERVLNNLKQPILRSA
jgi:hypothetical protein